jgi:Cdc6-like AAA superfamily ATPase
VKDFIVVDTEGSDEISEIAVIDSQGRLIYESFNAQYTHHQGIQQKVKPLETILQDFFQVAAGKRVVCHHAKHDSQVLQKSCRLVGLPWRRSISFECTYELAQTYAPLLPQYSLEYLSKKFNLKVHQKYFNPQQAHRARYDAEFTYQLYLKMMELQLRQELQGKPNPFIGNKVDNPFQDHPDLKQIFQNEFELLKSILDDIRLDRNHQSQGAIIVGEPGSGKTHLIMRLAKELLQVNRLLFIGQPNNPDSVLYHTYTRILKSFVETVPGNGYTQLENLLARSFVKVIRSIPEENLLKGEHQILAFVEEDPLKLYQLAENKPEQRQRLWQLIERRTNEWWAKNYGLAGYSAQIIKGIVKFCSYKEARRKELVTRWLAAHDLDPEDMELVGLENWREDSGREDFASEAISVFSKLSLLDEPLIIVFDQLEGLGLEYNKHLLERFGEAVKEIFTYVPNSLIILNLFPNRWQQFQAAFDGAVVDRISQHKIFLNRPKNEQITEILQLKARSIGIDLNTIFTSTEQQQILNQASIRAVLNQAADFYRAKVHGIQLPPPENKIQSHPPDHSSSTIEHRLDRLEQEFRRFQQAVRSIATALGSIYAIDSQPHATDEFELDELNDNSTIAASIDGSSEAKEKVLAYFQEQKQRLEQDYEKLQIITDSDDIGKLMTIAEAFRLNHWFEIDCLTLGKRKLPEHRLFQAQQKRIVVSFLQVDGSSFTTRLQNLNELVVAYKDTEFLLWRDVRQSPITGKVGLAEIEKLNNSANGRFSLMEKDDRIHFEFIYQLIVDIQNQDLDVDLSNALELISEELEQHWLIAIFRSLVA